MIHYTTEEIPYEILFGICNPHTKHLRPFGCKAIVAPNRKSSCKLESRAVHGINLGHIKGGLYTILCRDGVILTKHVRFNEREFPGLHLFSAEDKNQESDSGESDSHNYFHALSSTEDSHSDGIPSKV